MSALVGELASKLVQPSAEPRPELRREPSTVWQPPKQKVGLLASYVRYPQMCTVKITHDPLLLSVAQGIF